MRILDCKSPVCQELGKDAPHIIEFLCEECDTHFKKVQDFLTYMDLPFAINPKIVRGLDYYTKTVFEFITKVNNSDLTVCAGGRYDGLVEELGGKPTPGLGFGMGIERVLLVMEAQGIEFPEEQQTDIYIASMGENAVKKALKITQDLRDCGIVAECDLCSRGLKAQMKYASKINSAYSLVIGDSELENDSAEIKDMENGEKTLVSLGENFINEYITVTTKGLSLSDILNDE